MDSDLNSALTEGIQRAIIRKPLTVMENAVVSDAIAHMATSDSQSDFSQSSPSQANLPPGLCSSCVLVVDKNQHILGMVTERDVIRLIAQQKPLNALPVSQVMTQPSLILCESELSDVCATAEVLQQQQIRHLPVVDDRDRLVGLITPESLQAQWNPIVLASLSDRTAAEAQLEAQNLLLARLLKDEPLPKVLAGIIDCVKQQIKGPLCSFLLLDKENRLRYGAAPDLPKDYIDRTDGAPAMDGNGSCGTAVAQKSTVIVTDIATDPLWQNYKDIALNNGLRACWSHPVLASDGEVLGTFALYYPDTREPQADELEVIAHMASVAGIAIEREQTKTALAELNQELEQRVQERTAALQASQIQFRQLAENLPGMVYQIVIHSNGTSYFSYISSGIQEIYEIAPESIMASPTLLWDSMHPEDLAIAQHHAAESLQNLTPFVLEHRLVTKSGEKWIKSFSRPTQQENGSIFIDGVILEITDRKIAEAALEQEALRRASIFNTSVDGIHILDIEGNLLEANESFSQMLGYSHAEVLQLNVADWDAQWTEEELKEKFKQNFSDRRPIPPTFETFHRRKDGSIFPVEISQRSLEWQGEISLVCISRDISARKQAESELSLSRQKYYSLIQSVNGVVWEYDLQAEQFIFVSDKAEALLGYPISAWLEAPYFWRDHLYAEDAAETEAHYHAATSNQTACSLEYRMVAADGSLVWISDISTPHFDAQGQPTTSIGIWIDVGDRKQAELQLQQLNQELLRATKLKDEFLANMSHELRTPLNSILGMTEGLKEQILGSINSRQNDALEVIERSSSHLLELINDILDVAKFESGQLELRCHPTNVEALCKSSLAFIKQPALKKNIQLKTQISPSIPVVILDERRMRQVLLNLLSNAIKFTPQDGCVTLEVRFLSSDQQDSTSLQTLHISITDTGIGIEPDYITKLFQPFIQIDSALNRKFQGTGLGLTLVKQIVELHGGEVNLSSQLGEGSCFTIALPCTLAEPSIPVATVPSADLVSEEAQPSSLKPAPLILLAEDNEANIAATSVYLQAKGYQLILAQDGQEAIDLAQAHSPDLILMDIQMPVVDGLTAIARIRQISTNLAKTPIIALTALAMEGDRDRCLAAGANDYLSKPVKLKQLTGLMDELLNPPQD